MSTQFTNRQWRLPNNENKDKQSNYSMDKFDQNDYISTPLTIDEFSSATMSIWFKTSLSQNDKYFLTFPEASGSNGFDLNFVTSGIKSYLVCHSGASTLNSTFTYDDGNWHHVIVSYSGTIHKMYIDGVLTDSNSASIGTIKNAEGNLYIGALSSLHPTYRVSQTKLDQVVVFNYALSDGGVSVGQTATGQIATLYGGGSAVSNPMSLSPAPVAYYPLGDQDAFNGADYLVPNASLQDFVFSFDASNDYINLGNNSVLQPASNYTFSIWFNADSYSYKTLFGSNTSTSSGVLALPISNNSMTYYHATSTTTKQFNISLTDAPINNWHNFTVTWSATTGIIRAFINGKFKVELTGVSDINWGNELLIGRYYATYPFLFDGKLSNFSMWNTTLTDGFSGTPTTGDVAGGQVAEVYNNGSPQTTITGTPVGWWKLDASATYDSSTTTWTIPDSSSNSNDGTSSGMTQANLVQSDLSFTSGYSPYALLLDGTDDYIDCGNDSSLDITGALSISFWIYGQTNPAHTGIITKTPTTSSISSAAQYHIQYQSSNQLRFLVTGCDLRATTETTGTAPTVDVDSWQHFTMTWNGTNEMIVYKNGVEAATKIQSTTIVSNTSDLLIGRRLGYGYLNGKMSNVSIWNAALSGLQVREIYNEGVPQNLNNHSAYSNLVSWWQLGSNTSWVDPYWISLDEKGTNNGESQNVAAPNNMGENAIVDGVGSYANGLSSGMGGDEVIGDAPYSSSNSLSVNMDVEDRTTDTPS